MSLRSFLRSLPAVFIAATLSFLLMSSKPAAAQNLYASIRGTVTDQSGAAVPDVTLTATNTQTGVSRSVQSGADGSYQFLQLQVGTYTVKAAKSGFQTFTTTPFPLNVNQVYVQNFTMKLGSVNTAVQVEASTAKIDTTTMQLGTTITGRTITSMPLNGRNWTELQQLQPGVVGASDRFASGTGGAYSVDGSQTQQNDFLVNGIDTNDLPLNTPGIVPSPDAIGEFRMIDSTQNPEYGRNSGATINAVIKSGTNQFHGDAFEFYRDTFMDARSYFQQIVSPFHQNQFGGTIGGPIRKDRTFFFASYQGTRSFQPQAFTAPTVFSLAERTGDFSADTGGAFPIDNPNTGAAAVSPFPMVGENGITYPAGTPYATLFPTGIIPSADLNPLALKLMNQFVPPPNAPGNLYLFNPSNPFTDDQILYRLDEDLSASDQLWGYGLWERRPDTSTLPFTGATLPGFESLDKRHFQEYTIAWNHTFSPDTINEARFGYFRFNFDAVVPVNPIDPTSYGFTGIIPQTSTDASIPIISLSGLFTLGFSANGPQPRIDQTYQVIDNFSKIVGNHTLKVGFQMQRYQVFNPFFNNLGGNFSFNGSGPFSTGFAGADFLLGIPDSYAQGSGSVINARGREYYTYFQDEWRARKDLTLTLGLGWDVETPWVNLFDNGLTMAAFREGEQSTIFPTAPVGFVYPGDPGINKYGGPGVAWGDVGPRIGFAWSPDLGWVSGGAGSMSIRGGIGIYYNRTEEELALQGLTNPPFSITSSGAGAIGSPSFIAPFTGWCSITPGAAPTPCATPQVFPFTPPPPGSSVDFTPYEPIGLGMNTLSHNFGVPRVTNFNLTVERQLNPSTTLSVSYVGSIGRHEEGAYDLNMAGFAPGVNPGAAALGCTAFDLPTCDPTSFPLNPSVYGSTGFQVTGFNSNYNSLQVQFNKHLSHGLELLAGYTWSRYFDDTSSLENSAFNQPGINPFDFASMYAPSANDAPQRLVISWVYTLPFYSLTHHFRRLTDGWDLIGIATFQHGFPVAVFDDAFTSLTCDPGISFYACPDRANVTGTPLSIGNPRNYTIGGQPNYWFNPKAFAIPPAGTGIGDASRNPLYGPGINNWDISLMKDIHIDEARYFQFRLESFNTFNHTQFGAPDGDVSSPTFGRIFGVLSGSTQGNGRVLQLGGKFFF